MIDVSCMQSCRILLGINSLYCPKRLQEYAELQSATREQKAKPALEAIAEKLQKVGAVPHRQCRLPGTGVAMP